MTRDQIYKTLMEEFTDEQLHQAEAVLEKYKGKAGSLIPALEEIQSITDYLPDMLQEWIALGMNLPAARVFGVVTFYSFFSRVPKGKHQIKVCLGTACYVRGSKKIVERLEGELGICPGEVTKDRKYSLDTLRCLGACGLAPVMMIGEDTHRQVKLERLKEIIGQY